MRMMGVVSEGALYTRVHFTGMSLPAGARVFVYSMKNPDDFYGPYEGHGHSEDGTFWTPPMEGDGVVIEYITPNSTANPEAVPFRVLDISHIFKRISDTAPPASERTSIINEFGGAATSADAAARARALRRVAENGSFTQQESNKAFVLMQYFGYMRRSPNSAPDSDHSGYEFWLTKLNEFGGNFVNAEMVKAFIISSEYRQRFGH